MEDWWFAIAFIYLASLTGWICYRLGKAEKQLKKIADDIEWLKKRLS